MAMHPHSFPLLASDQADIIRIFIELMRDRELAQRGSEVSISNKPFASRDDSNHLPIPGELLDLD